MLRGLPCRSAGLTRSSGACSTASSCCSPARGSWTGSATSSWTVSFAASTRIKICHATVRTQSDARVTMQNESQSRPTNIKLNKHNNRAKTERVPMIGFKTSNYFSLKCFLQNTANKLA